jgi:broad specificity phosphatase PhoE
MISGTKLLLIRHAEVEARYQGVFGGRIDMDLSPLGRDQARALASHLRSKRITAAYASPMRRVRETIAPLLDGEFPKPTTLPGLREVDFGDWTGLSWEAVPERFGVSAFDWLDQLDCEAMPGAECGRALRERVGPCLREIIAAHPGGEVAVFCHGGVIRVMLAILLELPLPKTAAFEVDYASVTRVVVEGAKARVHLLNYTPWRNGSL